MSPRPEERENENNGARLRRKSEELRAPRGRQRTSHLRGTNDGDLNTAEPRPAGATPPALRGSFPRWARRAWPLLLTLLVTACIPASPNNDEFAKAGQSAYEWTRQAVTLGPRPPGSEAHAKLQDLISGALRDQKAVVVEEKFTALTPTGPVEMNNIIGKFPGRSDRIVVVSGHYDTYHRPGMYFVGANDGGSSTGFLLALGEWLSKRKLDDEVWLVFFDGEESFVHWEGGDNTYGSRYLASHWVENGTAPKIKALINVDMIGDADLNLVYEQNSTPWLRSLIWTTASRLGYERQFPQQAPGNIEDDHMPFLANGYSAVDLIDLQYGLYNRYWHTEEDRLDKLSATSFSVVLHVVAESLSELGKTP